MPTFEPQDPDFEARVRASFARQKVMETIGANLTKVAPGEVEIELPFRDDLTQQHGFLHAGASPSLGGPSPCARAMSSRSPMERRSWSRPCSPP